MKDPRFKQIMTSLIKHVHVFREGMHVLDEARHELHVFREGIHVQIITSLIKHVHAFAKDVQLTEEEWFEAIKFLTATGKMCDDRRQEFILLSDILGLSMMTVAIN